MVAILFTMSDVGRFYRYLFSRGVGLWACYSFCRYLDSHGKSYCFGEGSEKRADVDYVLYLKSIRHSTSIDRIISFIQRNEISIVIPTDVKDAQFLSYHKQALTGLAKLLVCDQPEWYDILDNKTKLNAFCRSQGIAVPSALEGGSLECLDAFVSQQPFPYYWKRACNTNAGKDVTKITSRRELRRLKRFRHRDHYLLQASVEGTLYSVDCLFDSGRLKSIFAKRELATSHRISLETYFFPKKEKHICPSHKTVGRLLPIIEKIGAVSSFSGIMDLEFIVNDREVYLIEINPRFPGGCYTWVNSEFLTDYLDCLDQCDVPDRTIRSNRETFGRLGETNVLNFYKQHYPTLLAIDAWQ
jgi:hypothetical protein